MSDPRDDHDPIDAAYARAEAVLDDEAARAARRARVLAAVAAEPAAGSPATSRPAGRPGRRQGGWLAAACVAALSTLVAVQIYRPPPRPATPAPAAAAKVQPQAPRPTPASPAADVKAADVKAGPSRSAARTADVAPPRPPHLVAPPRLYTPLPAPAPAPAVAQPAPPPPPPPPPALAAAAPTSADSGTTVGEVIVTSQKRAANVMARPAPSAFPELGDRLRAAAAAGRTGEVETLLTQGAPVDATDADGNTALMQAVQADRPAAAAALKRHGASLERRNKAGESARDMAASVDDAALNQALGLPP